MVELKFVFLFLTVLCIAAEALVELELNSRYTSKNLNAKNLKIPAKSSGALKYQGENYSQEPVEGEDQSQNNNTNFKNHPCARECVQNETKTCYYRLWVHNYTRLGPECNRCLVDRRFCAEERCIYGDGVPTNIMAINYQQPGPVIAICENDNVIVDVVNELGVNTTMHWHGLTMDRSPGMDGVPFVTQVPTKSGHTYRYSFLADRYGSNWYHDHVGLHRGLGLVGNFIIRQSAERNKQKQLYDFDLSSQSIILHDIFYNNDHSKITNILINGEGRNHTKDLPDNDPSHRYAIFNVTQGNRYRIRVTFNGVFNCPLQFSIAQHKLLVISTDGIDIKPILVDSFFIASGERYDFVLNANQNITKYWIKVVGHVECSQNNLYQGAILSYDSEKGTPNGTILTTNSYKNAQETTLNKPATRSRSTDLADNVQVVSLEGLEPTPWANTTKFLTYVINFGGGLQINDVSFKFPDFSLWNERNNIPPNSLCNSSTLTKQNLNCEHEHCSCVQVVQVPAYQPIEFFVVNLLKEPHPFHLHGYSYYVVGQGVLGNQTALRNITNIDASHRLPRTSSDYQSVQKDTTNLPVLGYIIVRFISNNTGFWFFHCHIEQHVIRGMAAVLQVGTGAQMTRT